MTRPVPFRADAAQKPYRPGFLRRSLAYMANGDLPPVLAFVWPAREPWIPPPPPVKRRPAAKPPRASSGDRALLLHISSVPSCNVLERSEHVAEWIRLAEEKAVHSRQVAANESRREDGRGHRPEGGRKAAAREIGVDEKAARRAAKVAGLSDQAKEIYEALHPETRRGSNQYSRSGKFCHSNFTEDTAEKTGQSARAVRLDAARGAKGVQVAHPLPQDGEGPLTVRPPAVKRTLADPGNRAGNVPENQRQSADSSHRTRRHNAVMSASADTALRACIAACCIIFMAFAGWAVTL